MTEEPTDISPYTGEELVQAESYLRKLPVALVFKERIRFDAIVTASDIIAKAYNDLQQFTIRAGSDVDNFANGGSAFALGLCWTIVDQLHAIRQLLKAPLGTTAGPYARRFLGASEPATHLRNHMDHLAGNLDNLANSKGPRLPLFGCLSYFYCAESNPTGGHIITIMSGALHGGDRLPCVNPAGKTFSLPTGLFTLSASNHELDLALSIGSLRDWLRRVEIRIESDILTSLTDQGISEEDKLVAMATLGGGLTIVMKIEFGTEPDAERRG